MEGSPSYGWITFASWGAESWYSRKEATYTAALDELLNYGKQKELKVRSII